MTSLDAAVLYAGLFILLFLLLKARVGQVRSAEKIMFGDGANERLQRAQRVQGNAEKQKADELSILATKMIEGLSVPEPALWGPQAVAMMKRSLIDTATLEGYRKSAYEKRVIAYGREKADRWCTERQAWHAKALQT